MTVGKQIPDTFKTFDEPLEVVMFKDYVRDRLPEFAASDIEELIADIRFDWSEWQAEKLEHDPAVGIRSPYKL